MNVLGFLKCFLILHLVAFWPIATLFPSPDLCTSEPPFLELLDHVLHGHPLDPFVGVDPLDDPLVHQHDLGFPADLRVDAHGEHEGVVLSVQEGKLVLPQAFDHVGVHEPVRRRLFEVELERRPVVQVPVGGDLDDLGGLDGRHGFHPFLRRLGHVGLGPLLAAVGAVVELGVVVHERVVVLDAKLLEEPDGLTGRRPRRCRPPSRFLAGEVGQHLDGFGQDVLLLLFRQGRDEFVSVAM